MSGMTRRIKGSGEQKIIWKKGGTCFCFNSPPVARDTVKTEALVCVRPVEESSETTKGKKKCADEGEMFERGEDFK